MNVLPSRLTRPTLPAVVLAALVAILQLAGCGGSSMPMPMPKIETPKAPAPTQLEMQINASKGLNTNTDGSAAPLLVRIYELANSGRFMSSGFFSLYENDSATLGADLVGREEIRFAPGQTRVVEKTLSPGTKSIGVMGAYRSTDQRRWRAVAPITPNKVNRFRLDLGARELSLSPQ